MVTLAQSEMNTQIILRQVTSTAEDLTKLNCFAGRGTDSYILSQAVALHSLQLQADPMVTHPAARPQNHRRANQIFYDRVESAVVEQVSDRHSPAYLWNLDSRPHLLADVFEC